MSADEISPSDSKEIPVSGNGYVDSINELWNFCPPIYCIYIIYFFIFILLIYYVTMTEVSLVFLLSSVKTEEYQTVALNDSKNQPNGNCSFSVKSNTGTVFT